MANTHNTEDLYWFGTEPYIQLLETCEYVFLIIKVLQKAYNRGCTSYSLTGSKCSRKGKMNVWSSIYRESIERSPLWKKAWLPLYSHEGQVTGRVGFS
jgi:hypothetical protein